MIPIKHLEMNQIINMLLNQLTRQNMYCVTLQTTMNPILLYYKAIRKEIKHEMLWLNQLGL